MRQYVIHALTRIVCFVVLGLAPNVICAQARLVVRDTTVRFEGNTGTDQAFFVVRFADTTSHGPVSMLFSTLGGNATGGTQCGGNVDYIGVTGGSLTFTAAQDSQVIGITICGDVRDENNETFNFNISNITGAMAQDGQGQATIIDDDSPPTLRIANVQVTEGAAGTTRNATFTVTMTGLTDLGATATVATSNGSVTNGATAGVCGTGDYVAVNGNVTFPPSPANQSVTTGATQPINVTVCGDALYEGNEQFQVRLTNPTNNATLVSSGIATGTITDDETAPTLSITPTVNVSEPADPTQTTPANFVVTLAGTQSQRAVTVSFATAPIDAEAGNCAGFQLPGSPPISKADYCSRSGTLTFTQLGQQTISVQVRGDQHLEPAESFRVTLSNAVRATIAQGTGTATIAASP